jgi:hypothetical protein
MVHAGADDAGQLVQDVARAVGATGAGDTGGGEALLFVAF